MMFGQLLYRFIHTTSISVTNTVTKSPLAVLRKRTGFSFVNCKKALQLFDNDVDKAEEWLQSQAQKEGWEKVEKLMERATKQGLVAACKSEKAAAMVEINCETDFVARSSHFKALVTDIISVCRKYAENEEATGDPVTKWNLSSSELALLPFEDGKTIADLLAMSVGRIGENINLRRALCMKVKDGLNFMVYSHPSSGVYDENAIHIGNYAAMVLYRNIPNTAEVTQKISLTEFGRQLCQHVIGMKPKTVGNMDDLKEESESSDEEQISEDISEDKLKKEDEAEASSESDSEDESTSSSNEEEDTETRLVHQKLVTDPETIVGHLLRQASIEVVDFARFERGEDISQLSEVK